MIQQSASIRAQFQGPSRHQLEWVSSGVWDKRTLADQLLVRATASPNAVAIIDGNARITLEGLAADALALSAALHARGLRPGDVVAFQAPNWGEAVVINLAAAMSGFVINPIVPIYRDHEVSLMLQDCGAAAFFAASSFRGFNYIEMAERLRPNLPALKHIISVRGDGPNDFAELLAEGRGLKFDRPNVDPLSAKLLLYTSGTTGRAKGVLHSHVTLQRIVRESARHWGVKDGEATLMPSPVTHISGYANGLEMPFIWGSQTVMMESWNAQLALSLIEEHKIVGTVAATPFLVELAAAARAARTGLPSFRFFACGGAAVPADLIPAANASFENCKAFRVYGASEVPLVTFGWPENEHLAATTDGEVFDYDVRIVDAEDRDLPRGQEGEILARGPGMMMGYADPAQTADAITPDGYFRTGDLGVYSEDRAITITGRKKDLIIRGGENISAKEIEDVLGLHPGVREACVVAMPHERLGEGVCAYVIAKEVGADAAALIAHVAASGLAKQKIPERFEFVEDFPRTASGKVRKDLLREDIRARLKSA